MTDEEKEKNIIRISSEYHKGCISLTNTIDQCILWIGNNYGKKEKAMDNLVKLNDLVYLS